MAIKKEISLLPEAENPNSFSAIFFKWLTTVGRWVIVITEFIVILAFISRFWLDRRNSDLSEIVRQQQSIIDSTKYFENEFSSFQERLTTIRKAYADQPEYDKYLSSLIKSTPQDLIYDSVSIKKNSDNEVEAFASIISFNENSIVGFINNLMVNSDIKTVEINKIEKKPKENNYTVTISVVFSSKKLKI